MDKTWIPWTRPGYMGRRRDEMFAALDQRHGKENWKLNWVVPGMGYFEYPEACRLFYEESYFRYLKDRTDDLNFITSFGECYDNAVSNIESGLDYTKQEAFSTHIQDIAVRNVLQRLGLKFRGPRDILMQIRSTDSAGYRFGPGNIPFYDPELITQPSKSPKWANPGSVEDFWQSNKWVMVHREEAVDER